MNATMSKPMTEMTTEHAALILRRMPTNSFERVLSRHSVRTLTTAGESLKAIEMAAQRTLTPDEVEAYNEVRMRITRNAAR